MTLSKETMINNVLTYWLLRPFRLTISLSIVTGIISCTNDMRQISRERLLDMIAKQEVKQITIVSDQTAEITLTPEALTDNKYADSFDSRDPLKNNKPHVRITIVSERAFRDELATMNPAFPIVAEKRSLFDFFTK